ncbi:hypothetical protein AVEN_203050-1 [Araneus ventricosus]|uniref:Uncharacterized protein n=1 Tax=Araneus ventricosus TaxID=182803 RepID=A0A4Y2GCK6_ARAVE|nr:hypothetical protein AVEN_203050-1 [Araneus ventricosus]
MDSYEKIKFLKKIRSAPIMKRAETPEDDGDDQNNKVKKAKSYNVKQNSAKKAMSATNVRRDESSKDEDDYKTEHPKIKIKEFFIALRPILKDLKKKWRETSGSGLP